MSNLQGLWDEEGGQQKAAEEARGDFTVLPPGWYTVVIKKAELKDTSTGGKMVVVDYETTGGDKITDRFNIKNASSDAQRIGRQQLAKMATCAGVPNLNDTTQLFGMSLDVKLKIEKFKSNTTGNELESNKVSDYKEKGKGVSSKASLSSAATSKEDAPW
jgi:hypothetical protein